MKTADDRKALGGRDRRLVGRASSRAVPGPFSVRSTFYALRARLAGTLAPPAAFLSLLAFTAVCLQAYPPAPHHLLFGQVRDEWGKALDVAGAEVLLETSNGRLIRVPVHQELERGANYFMPVPMDAGLTPERHKPTAMRPEMPFRMRVRVGNEVLLPIELAANDGANIGRPGHKTRLNLTLGVDADGDGLPDAWERELLSQLSELDEINPDDDADGDGLSNLEEYLAGSYAYDGEHELALEIVGFSEGIPTLEFLAIEGRQYRVLGSTDLEEWSDVSFQLEGAGEGEPFVDEFVADDVRNVRITIEPPGLELTPHRYFKLLVQ